MSKADVGLIPHLQTAHNHLTVPNKIFDYMAGHLPVLSAKLESLEEILATTGAGLVFPEYTVEGFVDTLLQLRDPVVRFKLGQNGRMAFQSQYHWEQDFSTMHAIVTGHSVAETCVPAGNA
jgi:glycosyltransferase involved in cell wall biosynthesis